MWRLLFFVAMPLWGEDVFVEEGDAGYLEQRLDDGGVLRDLSLRWRVRGAEKSWERLQVYQRVEWKPRDGQAFFGLVERDPGEREWRDFSAFYYRVAGKMVEVVIGDLRPGFGAGGGVASMRGCRPLTVPGWSIGRAGRMRRCVVWCGVMAKGGGKGYCWVAAPGETGG